MMKPVSFSVPVKMIKQMRTVRRKTKVNWSAIVRKAIQKTLNRYY